MRVNFYILNIELDTLETRNIRCHSLGFQTTGCVTNINSAHKRNVLYSSKSMSKFSMIFHFCLIKGISCQCKCSHQLSFIFRFCTKRCINLSKLSSCEPFIYQLHDLIILINTKTKRRLENSEIQVRKDIPSFLVPWIATTATSTQRYLPWS